MRMIPKGGPPSYWKTQTTYAKIWNNSAKKPCIDQLTFYQKFVKIRLSVPLLNANINIKELKPSSNGFILTSKNGTNQDISMEIVTTVLNFVDNGKPGEIKSKNPFKPNIKLTKVQTIYQYVR